MSMRTYAGLLIFEDLYDYVPTGNSDIYNLAQSVFEPNVMVIEEDCHTTLGKFETVNYELEGVTELATGLIITKDRINELLSQGIYEVATRHLSTCISRNGICSTCFAATYSESPVPKVLDRVTVYPLYLVNAEVVELQAGVSEYTLITDPTIYTKKCLWSNGILLTEGIDFTINGFSLTMLNIPTVDVSMVARFGIYDRSPFLVWLASTYAGAILGMESLPTSKLPVRSLFLSSTLLENRLQLISDFIKGLEQVPTDYSGYSDLISDPLEKALFMIAVYSIYYNATT